MQYQYKLITFGNITIDQLFHVFFERMKSCPSLIENVLEQENRKQQFIIWHFW